MGRRETTWLVGIEEEDKSVETVDILSSNQETRDGKKHTISRGQRQRLHGQALFMASSCQGQIMDRKSPHHFNPRLFLLLDSPRLESRGGRHCYEACRYVPMYLDWVIIEVWAV